MPQKRCPRCKEWKPITDEHWTLRKTGEPKSYCKPCYAEYNRHIKANPSVPKRRVRDGVEEKRCKKCLLWFPITAEFWYINKPHGKPIPFARCKPCHRTTVRKSDTERQRRPVRRRTVVIAGEEVEERKCPSCKEWKPKTAEYWHFYKHTNGLRYSRPDCKPCHRAKRREAK